MFIITLKFADKSKAPAHMDGHKAWIRKGFDEGIFLMVGSLEPSAGGVVMAHGAERTALEAFVQADPFVAEGVVTADILEISPARTDDRLAFLAA